MDTLNRVFCLSILTLLPLLSAADVVVSHFEPLQKTELSANAVRFDALGLSFDLQLQTNDRVLSGLHGTGQMAGIGVYRGQLANKPGSWVRIVVYDGMPRGLIWDGREMFAIEAPGDGELSADTAVIYRLADSYIVPGSMQCGTQSLSGNTAAVWKSLAAAGESAIARAPGAVSEITMSAIGDYEFTNDKGGDAGAVAAITTRLNNVDGFFSEQVGVQINVQLIETHSDPNDPFGDTLVSDELLDELSEYRLQTPAHNSRGLTHLYTGRNFDTTTVGVAWRGTLCQNYFGAGLTEGRGSALNDSLIAAHEIGHNFGAEHDGEAGTPCAADTAPYIMSPSINGSQQFSACSIGIMQAEAAAASCVVALPTVDVSIAPQGPGSSVLLGAVTDFNYRVTSNGTLSASAVIADFTLPATLTLDSVTATSGSCTSGAGTASCSLGDLAGLSSQTITLRATPASVGTGSLVAAVSTSDTDERPSNNQDNLLLTVSPAVDLVVTTLTTAPVFVNDATVISATLNNLSILDATSVTLSVTLEAGLQANTASWSLGSCTVAAQQIDCQATTFAAQSSSSLSIAATGITAGRRDVTVSLSSSQADANPGNNSALSEVQVVSPQDERDEGGGATGPLALLLLAGALARRRRRVQYPYALVPIAPTGAKV
ncbi:MAG: M12 family metallo-peptidase [Gammaproteobacteria bacterium]|nr:M12 family metallo-peptidase [Gammaproteobacteria bacterium]MDH5303511.1 M12 family metallo-peptidase [Gammaproteobacteria bacterium]MDH5322790.1 M12 family metallo-peptidase [Gammaproteobacteria bacterium]